MNSQIFSKIGICIIVLLTFENKDYEDINTDMQIYRLSTMSNNSYKDIFGFLRILKIPYIDTELWISHP